MIKEFLERRRLKRILERYMDPDAAGRFAAGGMAPRDLTWHDRDLEVAFIAIFTHAAPEYSERAGIIADMAGQCGGIAHSLLPVVVVSFGCLRAAQPGARLSYVESVRSRFPDSVAIVHGAITSSIGSFGGESLQQFGFWWPGALGALRLLATLSPGQVHELPLGEAG